MASFEWPSVLKSVAARDLAVDEARIWHKAIKEDYSDITDQELCDVLTWAFHANNVRRFQKDSPFAYTQPMLSYWIKQYRDERRRENACPRCGSVGMFSLYCRRRPGGHIVRFCTFEEWLIPMDKQTQTYPDVANVFCTCDLGQKMYDKEVKFEDKQSYLEFREMALDAQTTCGVAR